jgi:hypothetical protein
LLVLLVGPAACGRVGFDLLPLEQGHGNGGAVASDASPGRDASMDASGGAAMDAQGGGTGGTRARDAGQGGTSGRDATASGGAPADASRDAVAPPVDAAPDAAHDAAHDAGCGGPARDYCAEVGALAADPVIDGRLECGLALATVAGLGWTAGDAGVPNVTAEYAIAWRPGGLYFFVRVHDASRAPADVGTPTWYGDGAELYVDDDGVFAAPPSFDTVGTRQLISSAPVDAVTSSLRGEIYDQGAAGFPIPWTPTTFVSVPTPDGYVLEAFVTAAHLGLATWALAAGAHVGWDIGINMSYPDPSKTGAQGHRLGQFFASFPPGTDLGPFKDVGAFCKPLLTQP